MKKGDQLELDFFEYLNDQITRGEAVLGFLASNSCKIFRQKSYYCSERANDITFDVVLEVKRLDSNLPALRFFFECKDYATNVPEEKIRTFSDQVSGLSRNGAKAYLVTRGGVQSGGQNLLSSRGIGWIQFNSDGIEFRIERNVNLDYGEQSWADFNSRGGTNTKPPKFLAKDGEYSFSNPLAMIQQKIDPSHLKNVPLSQIVPFLDESRISKIVMSLLERVEYVGGPVDLKKILTLIEVDLKLIEFEPSDKENSNILGYADFENRDIVLIESANLGRDRFTLAHEIGHFCLGHEHIIRNETVLLKDLFVDDAPNDAIRRLEIQANKFASFMLMPRAYFYQKLAHLYELYGFRNIGHGVIFVDNQPCNFVPYNSLLTDLSEEFQVSKQAVEYRLREDGILSDERNFRNSGFVEH